MKNISKFHDIGFIFTAQTNIQTNRQINFEMSDGNKINNVTTGKKKPFQSGQEQLFKSMDVLFKGLSISDKKILTVAVLHDGKMMSLRCHFLAANGWRLID